MKNRRQNNNWVTAHATRAQTRRGYRSGCDFDAIRKGSSRSVNVDLKKLCSR